MIISFFWIAKWNLLCELPDIIFPHYHYINSDVCLIVALNLRCLCGRIHTADWGTIVGLLLSFHRCKWIDVLLVTSSADDKRGNLPRQCKSKCGKNNLRQVPVTLGASGPSVIQAGSSIIQFKTFTIQYEPSIMQFKLSTIQYGPSTIKSGPSTI